MTIKRLILALITIFAIAKVFFSLNESLSQPQIQGRLELYQTNLVLQVAEFKPSADDPVDLSNAIDSLVGNSPYAAAIKQYQKASQQAQVSRENWQTQLQQLASLTAAVNDNSSTTSVTDTSKESSVVQQQQQLQKQIQELDLFIDELDLKQGILYLAQNNRQDALSSWDKLITRQDNSDNQYLQTAIVLQNLWQQPAKLAKNSELIIQNNLHGWFRDRALEKLYQVQEQETKLANLQFQENQLAIKSIFKLGLISGIPVFGGIAGVAIFIFLIVQLLIKKADSILAINNNRVWKSNWNWEITWQVLIIGFFFVGQFLLPLFLGIVGFNPIDSSLRIKALYVFSTYLLMAAGGVAVLYISIKPYLPLDQDWFKFDFISNWFIWGFGGYLIAIPFVLLVSLINQQIWQGQGGSNPLLFLALQAQDTLALAIFFITASIAAPIFEEIMFRGFLLPSLTRYVPVWVSIIISGLIFAIAHLSLSEVLPLATLGIILGFVYTRSRNLLAPMLLHSLWNSGTLISLFVLGGGL